MISLHPSAYALERAAKAGIPSCVVARKEYPSNQAMTVALVDKLKEAQIDLVVLAGFMVILTQEMVQAYPNAILNVHPALIPSFAGPGCYGLHVHEKALEYGVKLTGATVHLVSEECDGGPIVSRRRWRFCPTTPRRSCSAGSWSSASAAPAPGGVPVLPGPAERGGADGADFECRMQNAECRMIFCSAETFLQPSTRCN